MVASPGTKRFPPTFPATALNSDHQALGTGQAQLLSAFVLPTYWPDSALPEGTDLESITTLRRSDGKSYEVSGFRPCRCLSGEEHFHFYTKSA